eukprot:CAMPEP_0113464292 /NCGR_PEP_ID=MMETSP0014_2-20120614/13127_1 /TAXON_ID=2857 /ORGANISM="Nitzschia sp." /LENGTH=417 /DNA_ID=CAMNT_0000356371 /DNA_START=432 /DNA_END=1685 /DNA_ORIENTATION=+ /assembly_acc=CAM_ASM_000159
MITRFPSKHLSSILLLLAAAAAAATDVTAVVSPPSVEPDAVVSRWMVPTISGGRVADDGSAIDGFRPIVTEVGKKIRFEWSSSEQLSGNGEENNVYLHQNLDCDPTGSVLIGNSSPTEFVWTDEFANKQWLLTSHNAAQHKEDQSTTNPCELGQFVLVQVDEAPKPTWTIRNWAPPPDGKGFAPLDVVVGETIRWEWTNDVKNQLPSGSASQTVFAHKGSQLDCFFDNAETDLIEFIGPADIDTNPRAPMKAAWYTFSEDDGSRDGRTMWFTSASEECFRGNILTVTVYKTQADLELAHRRPVNCRTGSGCRPQDKNPPQPGSSSDTDVTDAAATGSSVSNDDNDSDGESNYSNLFADAVSSSSGGGSRPDKPNNGSDRDRDDATTDSGAFSTLSATTTSLGASALIFVTMIGMVVV